MSAAATAPAEGTDELEALVEDIVARIPRLDDDQKAELGRLLGAAA